MNAPDSSGVFFREAREVLIISDYLCRRLGYNTEFSHQNIWQKVDNGST